MFMCGILRSVMDTIHHTTRDWIGDRNIVILAGISLVLHICALLWFQQHHGSNPILLGFSGQYYLLLTISITISMIVHFLYHYKNQVPITWFILHIIVLSMMGYPMGSSLSVELLLGIMMVMEIGLFMKANRQTLWILTIFIVLQLALQHPTRVDGIVSGGPPWSTLIIHAVMLSVTSVTVFAAKRLSDRLNYYNTRVNQLEQSTKLLINANRSFQEYAYDVEEKSKKEERMRITREIHDLVGYSTINVSMMLEEAIDHYIREDVNQLFPLIMKARDQTKATHQDIRKVLAHFRSDHAKVTTIANDLQRMTRKFSDITGIAVDFQATQAIPPVSTEVHAQLLRIVQEGLTNAIQHGKATEVSILLTLFRNHIHLVIEDNGKGAAQIKEGIGLTGMRERLASISGAMTIVNSVGEFKLIIDIPLSQEVEDSDVSGSGDSMKGIAHE